MNKKTIKILLAILIWSGLFLTVTTPLLATNTDAGTKIKQGITETGASAGLGTPNTDLRETIALIIRYLLGFLGILFTILIIYGGFLWMTAAGNDQQIDKAKKILTQATIGLLIVILAYALSTWIFRAILWATYQPY